MSDSLTPPGAQERLLRAMRQYTVESDMYVAAASHQAAVHRTDLEALAMLMDRGDTAGEGEVVTPGWLRERLQLSASATSAVLDRLEQHGHVERQPHPHDRRSVHVRVTDHAREVGRSMFGPLVAHLGPVLARRTPEELEAIASFLEEAGAATRDARLAGQA